MRVIRPTQGLAHAMHMPVAYVDTWVQPARLPHGAGGDLMHLLQLLGRVELSYCDLLCEQMSDPSVIASRTAAGACISSN